VIALYSIGACALIHNCEKLRLQFASVAKCR